MNEYLRRIDEKDYLTEREHREYLFKIEEELNKGKVDSFYLNILLQCLEVKNVDYTTDPAIRGNSLEGKMYLAVRKDIIIDQDFLLNLKKRIENK